MIPQKNSGYRILHTADWHLGKLLNGKSRHFEHSSFLDWLLKAIVENSVDAVLLAGDVFDSANPPQHSVKLYYDFVSKLPEKCQFVVIAGNHDSPAFVDSPKQLLSFLNTRVVGQMPSDPEKRIIYLPDDENRKVAIAAVPFLRDRDIRIGRAGEDVAQIRKNVAEGIQRVYQETAAILEKDRSTPAIAMGHLTVLGGKSSDSERDIHIGGLGSVSTKVFSDVFKYVALGHLHKPQCPGGDQRVHYSGSPIPLSFSECSDKKEVKIVDLNEGELKAYSLPIPQQRQLYQIRTKVEDLEHSIEQFESKESAQDAWIEIIITDESFKDDILDRVQITTSGKSFEVLKVIRESSQEFKGMDIEGKTDDEALESILGNPMAMFENLLAEKNIDASEQKILIDAFQYILEEESNE